MTAYVVVSAATLLLLVRLCRPGESALRVLGHSLVVLVRTPGGRMLAGVALFVLFIDLVETNLDPELTHGLGYDLTPLVFAIEGDVVARLQRFTTPWSSFLLAWVYAPGFVALLCLPPIAWLGRVRNRATAEYLTGIASNYVFAMPFYLFAPVREVGWSELTTARPLLEHAWPGITEMLRSASAVDNCFPSLHVSCTLTVFLFARRHGPPRLAWIAGVGGALTAWATIVLGVHWATDVVAGLFFGWGCTAFAARMGEAFWPDPVRETAEEVVPLTPEEG